MGWMGWRALRPDSLEERLIHGAIIATWGIWLIGGLYVAAPVLGYLLIGILAARWLGLIETRAPLPFVPITVMLWLAGTLAMLIGLWIAHANFEIELMVTMKSTIGWMKGWALVGIFILAGALLPVRAAIVYRATGLLALQTMALTPFLLFAGLLSLPSDLYVSPLQIVGGPGPEFFDVTLYAIDDTTHTLRWRFFAPWATAAAFLAGISFVFALYERDWRLKLAGIVCAVVVCAMAGSRTSIVALPVMAAVIPLVANVRRPAALVAIGFLAAGLLLLSEQIALAYEDFQDKFDGARAASSRARATLASMAWHRWLTEAPVFGHGIVERGPKLVHHLPIGSHHTWLGLLFVRGAVGFLALAVPLAASLAVLAFKAQSDRAARAGLGVLLAVAMFSFGDNLEMVAYLIWPGFVVVGIALRRRFCNPYVRYLGAGPG